MEDTNKQMSVDNFLSTIRAADPDKTSPMSDDELFTQFVNEYPNEPQVTGLSGLSIGQMATILRSKGNLENASDFTVTRDFLKANPEEHRRLNTESRVKLGIYKMAKGLPMAGAVAGGMASMAAAPGTMGASLAGASLMAGGGAALGKAAENVITAGLGADESPKTAVEGGVSIIKEGAIEAAINLVGGKILASLGKKAKPAAAQAIKAFEGIDERSAIKVLNDPDILLRAKPMEQAEKEFGEFVSNSGYKYGKEAVEEVTGAFKISENQANKLINKTIKRVEQVKGFEKFPENSEFIKDTVQEALAGRYELGSAMSRELAGGNKAEVRAMMSKIDKIDEWLETQIPGFKNIRKEYSEAKIKEAFSPFLPTNKNGTVSVLRTLSALGASVLNPTKGVPYLLASSPFVGGTTLKAGAMAAPAKGPIGALASYLTGEALNLATGIKDRYKKGEITRDEAAKQLRDTGNFK